jgi:hypothetical protein
MYRKLEVWLKQKRAGNMAQVVECLTSKHKAWVQTPVPSKRKGKEGGREGRKEGSRERNPRNKPKTLELRPKEDEVNWRRRPDFRMSKGKDEDWRESMCSRTQDWAHVPLGFLWVCLCPIFMVSGKHLCLKRVWWTELRNEGWVTTPQKPLKGAKDCQLGVQV